MYPQKDQIADVSTKRLNSASFYENIFKLGRYLLFNLRGSWKALNLKRNPNRYKGASKGIPTKIKISIIPASIWKAQQTHTTAQGMFLIE